MKQTYAKLGRTVASLLVAEAMLPVVAFGNVPASEQTEMDEIETAVRNVSDISDITSPLVQEGNELIAEYADNELAVDKTAPDNVSIRVENGLDFKINLPEADRIGTFSAGCDLLSYGVNKDNFSVSTETADGVVRNCFVLENKAAPERFEVKYELPEGVTLRFARDESGKTDGSIEGVDKDNTVVMAITIPWARDALGTSVNTHYELNGNKLTQVVEHQGESNLEYPIVADPSTQYSNWFTGAEWYKRSSRSSGWEGSKKQWTLSLFPSKALWGSCVGSYAGIASGGALGMAGGATLSKSVANAAWSAAYAKHHTSKHWKNTKSMKSQFLCHIYLLPIKRVSNSSWLINIEPARPYVRVRESILKKCNP